MSLHECPGCHRHHLASEPACPFCDGAGSQVRPFSRSRARLTGVVMTALTPVVLAACYGMGPAGYDTWSDSDTADLDEDGYAPIEGDCDDTNANVNPEATEVCDDEIDNDCDELVDILDDDCDEDTDSGS